MNYMEGHPSIPTSLSEYSAHVLFLLIYYSSFFSLANLLLQNAPSNLCFFLSFLVAYIEALF